MNRDEVIAKWNWMNPQERNIWVAVKVMGKKKSPINYGWISSEGFDHYPKDYSTGMGAAWEVIEHMKKQIFSKRRRYLIELQQLTVFGEGHVIAWPDLIWHMTPERICLAALIATQGKEIEE
ncbi:BC1872 family protein [Paenibacillus maysiensis]|uniref:BC1872 family protein n=1 Tax=Paenibacillus maysiensis TaxID=1155954 RepID=UPI000471EB36|nr:hypothetical protein [Paenibacillus maysiensis]